jgi:drug/metabolite transporter (DMT)-like permease
MRNFLLYALIVVIWGSTWYAIKLQLNGIATEVSVTYRFALATLLLWVWCGLRRLRLRFSGQDHVLLILLGLTLFSTNYVLLYEAEKHVVSGSVAIMFSLLVVFNIFNGRVFFGLRSPRRVIAGALLGLVGITLTFWPQLRSLNTSSQSFWGIALSLAGTLSASFGTLVSARLQNRSIMVVQANAFGMLYGTAVLLSYAVLSGAKFSFDFSLSYVGSLLYLALFGSVVGFCSYITLVGRIGADRAAYVTILFPIVALLFSVAFEGYRLHWLAVLGITCVLVGNGVVLWRRRTRSLFGQRAS